MRILVIGSGGREHALSDTFHRQGHTVYCLPGNAGTTSISEPIPPKWSQLDVNNLEETSLFAQAMDIDLTVVGPEDPLKNGIVDLFNSKGLKIFGPTKQGAMIESSKVFSKIFMQSHKIPTAPFHVCRSHEEAKESLILAFQEWEGVVIKPDGLTGGKGVIPCDNIEEAREAVSTIMEEKKYGVSGNTIIIEKKLTGSEVSILAFSDGSHITPMIPSQDHKKLYDKDLGPNTGGIGAYTPLPFLSNTELARIRSEIIDPTLQGLIEEGIHYKGVIYFGLMLTDEGPQVLEYNCRFGDPEAQATLPLLKTDLAKVMEACIANNLHEINLQWSQKSACCVVMTSKGYPHSFQRGYPISGLEAIAKDKDIFCYHAGTSFDENHSIVTSGGRVLAITALGEKLEVAIDRAYQTISKISFSGAYYRKDIAQSAFCLLQSSYK